MPMRCRSCRRSRGRWRRRVGGARLADHLPRRPRAGGGASQVSSNWDIKPIYDVIATLHGAQDEGQWVLRGNHHDAWVNGAEDPISGQAAMLEEARMLGELHAAGLEAGTHHHLLRVGRRGAGPAGLGRMGRDASR